MGCEPIFAMQGRVVHGLDLLSSGSRTRFVDGTSDAPPRSWDCLIAPPGDAKGGSPLTTPVPVAFPWIGFLPRYPDRPAGNGWFGLCMFFYKTLDFT